MKKTFNVEEIGFCCRWAETAKEAGLKAETGDTTIVVSTQPLKGFQQVIIKNGSLFPSWSRKKGDEGKCFLDLTDMTMKREGILNHKPKSLKRFYIKFTK